MRQYQDLENLLHTAQRQQQVCAQGLLMAVDGSTYRRPGARMLVTSDGRSCGLISGGCLEGQVTEAALEVIARRQASWLDFDLRREDDDLFGSGLGCEGRVQILVEPLFLDSPNTHMALGLPVDRKLTWTLTAVQQANGKVQQVIRCLLSDEHRLARLRAFPAVRELRNNVAAAPGHDTRARQMQWRDWFLLAEPRAPTISLHVFGAGADALPLVSLASQLGWQVTVIDHRPAYLSQVPRGAGVELVQAHPDYDELSVPSDPWSAAVLMTHNLGLDTAWLRRLAANRPAFVGTLGPRKRQEKLAGHLGLLPESQWWHGPVGLDLGTDTPESVALSITGEITGSLNQASMTPLNQRKTPINLPPVRIEMTDPYAGTAQPTERVSHDQPV